MLSRLGKVVDRGRLGQVACTWIIGVLAIIIASAALPSYWQAVIIQWWTISLAAMALSALMGWVQLHSICSAAILLVGGYAASAITGTSGAPLIFGLLGGVLAGCVAGLCVGVPALRISGLYLLLGTFAFQFIIGDAGNLYESDSGHLSGLYLTKTDLLGGVNVASSVSWLILTGVCVLLAYSYMTYIRRGRIGRAWLVMHDHADAASIAGINTTRYTLYAYGLYGAVTGLAGALMAAYVGNTSYDGFGLLVSVQVLVMGVLGGAGSLGGAVLGAGVVTVLPFAFSESVGGGSGTGWLSRNLGNISTAAYAVIALVVVVFLNRGLTAVAASARRLRAGKRNDVGEVAEHELPAGTAIALDRVSVQYGAGESALRDVDVDVPVGGLYAVVGRNGAGKTSLLMAIAGFAPRSGRVARGRVRGRDRHGTEVDLTGLSIGARVDRGFLLVPADRKLFDAVTVADHLKEAVAFGERRGSESGAGRLEGAASVESLLALFPSLRPLLKRRAGFLSGGEKQQLALAVALGRGAETLLIDEASLGLSPRAVREVAGVLRQMKERRALTMVVVEQNVSVAFDIADQVALLDDGKLVKVGSADAQMKDEVELTYLGKAEPVRSGVHGK